MRKVKTIVKFKDKDNDLKIRDIGEEFEVSDNRASILLNLKYVELVKVPIILDSKLNEPETKKKTKPNKKRGK